MATSLGDCALRKRGAIRNLGNYWTLTMNDTVDEQKYHCCPPIRIGGLAGQVIKSVTSGLSHSGP